MEKVFAFPDLVRIVLNQMLVSNQGQPRQIHFGHRFLVLCSKEKRTLLSEEAQKRGHEVITVGSDRLTFQSTGRRQLKAYYDGELLPKSHFLIPRIMVSGGNTELKKTNWKLLQALFRCKDSLNRQEASEKARDKMLTHLELLKDGIPSILTLFGKPSKLKRQLDQIPTDQIIVKVPHGSQGLDIHKMSKAQFRENLPHRLANQAVLVQPYIPEAREDIRVYVVNLPEIGPRIVGAQKRVAKAGEFRSNAHQGGSQFLIPPDELDPRIDKLAIQATQRLGLNFAGVDIIETPGHPNGNHQVMEVNSTPGWAYHQKLTDALKLPSVGQRVIENIEEVLS